MDRSYFDQPFSRMGTHCVKWDSLGTSYNNAGAIPMWIADMDFPIAPEITQALAHRIAHPAYGYTLEDPAEKAAFRHWMVSRHNWDIPEVAIEWMPSVLTTVRLGVALYTRPGDRVMIMTPVYPPFTSIPKAMDRQPVPCPLLHTDSGWFMDLNRAEDLLRDGVKLLILCSPHNPVGRVWTRQELTELVALFARYGGKIVADEIHHDLILPGYRHTSFLTIPGAEELGISGVSGTKTFNLAGLEVSAAVLPEAVRQPFRALKNAWGFPDGNILAHTAQTAAYQYGAPWLEVLLSYIEDNRRLLEETVHKDFNGVSVSRLEGTYLAWLDFRSTGIPAEELSSRAAQAGVAAGRGEDFGGPGFLRYNLACPRPQLEESLRRLHTLL